NNNACQSSPCLNGGTCSVDPVKESEYTCICPNGFSGQTCQEKVHCHPNPCENGGTCHEQDHMYSTDSDWWCECNKGYTGQTCTQYDPCTGFNCHNGGRCQSSGGIPTCTCIAPYTGATC
ncbi:predicted protein, partial [Nematostella vectensis]